MLLDGFDGAWVFVFDIIEVFANVVLVLLKSIIYG